MFFSRFTVIPLYMEVKVGFTDSCPYCTCFCLRGAGAHTSRRSIKWHGHFFPERHELSGL